MEIRLEHLGIITTILGIIISTKTILSWSTKKHEENNRKILELIDKKLDKVVYEKDQANFKAWSDERDKILDAKIKKLEDDIKGELKDIKESLKEINAHMLNCNKRGVG